MNKMGGKQHRKKKAQHHPEESGLFEERQNQAAADHSATCKKNESNAMPQEKKSSWVPAATLFVGVVVAIIYFGQLRAMHRSNEISQENMESVQRALVFFGGQAGYIKRLNGKRVAALTITIPWLNVGVTPAMNGVSKINWKTFPSPNGIPDNFTYPDEGDIQLRQFEIPPKGQGNGTMDVPIEWINAAKEGSVRLFIHGWTTYDDVFKGKKEDRETPRHLSEFCDEITNIASTPTDLTDPNVNITWELSLCREHNCSDERCKDYSEKTR